MPIVWNTNLVTLSVLVAMFGSFAALSHAERMRENTGRPANAWMVAGGVTLGMAIWAMHFIGMLAFHLPVPIAYDAFLTFVSVLPAVAAALLGFYVLQNTVMQLRLIAAGGFYIGIGIITMHYTGMAALKMQPAISYDPLIFGLSLLIAIGAAIGALLIVYAGEKSGLHPQVRHSLGALIMACAIAGMHYTAMAGASFAPGSISMVGITRINPTLLALIVVATVFLLFGGGWVANLFDRSMAHLNAEALRQLSNRNNELAMDCEILRQINLGLPLSEVLDELARQAEALHPGMLCSILLLDKDGKHLRHGAAPSLPESYNKALDGLPIGQGVGSFGTAVHCGERIIVEDVQQHPYWAPYLDLARLADIRSCWSQPIKDNEHRVFGTFSIYHKQPATPSEAEITLIERYAYLAQLVIQRKASEEEIKHMAFHDTLTQLPNRRLLLDRLQQAIAASTRSHHYGAVMFLDLDNFKVLNDTNGHDIGDLMLVEVAARLQGCVREGDTVARMGGDEFVVMLADLGGELEKSALQAEVVAEKIHKAINQPYTLKKHKYRSTASLGISQFCGNAATVGDLLKHADTAMYQAKHAGRNSTRFFNPSMQEALETRAALETDLRQALAQQRLSLYYQRQVDSDGHVFGAEGLLRWKHQIHGLVSPAHFIPLAEESGLIHLIGHYVLQTACEQLKLWESDRSTRDLILSVNVSNYQFQQSDFVDQVREVLRQASANPSRLKLEITESMVTHNVPETIEKMQALKALGVRFSMDDFGTGYSSLAYLKRLPIDELKIDQSFVHDIASNSNDAIIVKTIIAVGNTLGLRVIAKGVETDEQLELLKQYDCPAFQGFLFAAPVPLQEFEHLLKQL